MQISDEIDEKEWNKAFDDIALTLKSLQYLYINIDLQPFETCVLEKWQFKKPPKNTFLKDLLRLKNLRLKAARVIVSDYHSEHSGFKKLIPEWIFYRWTTAQKQEWAAHIMRVLLRQEDQGDLIPDQKARA